MSIDAMDDQLVQLRTQIPHPGLLTHVEVECYGTKMALQELATISVSGKQMLSVNVYDKSIVKNVESAIMKANLGLLPIIGNTDSGDSSVIQVPIPKLDTNGKKEVVKVISRLGEAAKVTIRNHRKDAMQSIRKLPSSVSEDEKRRGEKDVQKEIDDALQIISKAIASKEKEVMSV